MVDGSGFQVGVDAPQYYQDQVGLFMAPFVARLVASAVRTGDTVLDVACGTGFATRAAAEAAGPSGRAVGTDLNPEMIAMARSVPHGSGSPIAWHEASALKLPFEDDSFDAVICQQGIQFFPDVPAGLAEMRRVLRPGGLLGATVWAPLEQSPFLAAETQALIELCGADPTNAAQAFPAGGGPQLTTWFTTAGLQPTIQLIEADVHLPAVRDYVPEHLKALPWSAGFFTLRGSERDAVLNNIQHRLRQHHHTNNGLIVPFRSYLLTTIA